MSWLIYAFLCALSLAIADLISKKLLSSEDPITVAFARWFYAGIFLLPVLIFARADMLLIFNRSLGITLALLIPLEILAVILYMKAYHLSDLSLSAPFQSFTPLFSAAISFVLLGEKVNILGFAGVALVVAGSYVMGTGTGGGNALLRPFRMLLREKGPVYMLMVAFIYGITSVLGKAGVLKTGSLIFAGLYIPVLSVFFAVYLFFTRREALQRAFSRPARFLPLGVFMAVMVFTHFKAIEMVNVAYMISVKRLSMVFAVFLGHFILGEGRFFKRLAGGVIMFVGALLVALGHAKGN